MTQCQPSDCRPDVQVVWNCEDLATEDFAIH
jgi:hypothetical protein